VRCTLDSIPAIQRNFLHQGKKEAVHALKGAKHPNAQSDFLTETNNQTKPVNHSVSMMTIAFAESFMLTPHKPCCSLNEKIAGTYFTVASLTLQRRPVLGQYPDAAITTLVKTYQLQHSLHASPIHRL
jgi:hypothetical protein